MRLNHDIISEAPITEELLYNINTYLIPCLAKTDSRLSAVKIEAPVETALIPNIGAVGTGLSCGVDSFHAIHNNTDGIYKENQLTHLIINNVGAFNECYAKYGIDKVKKERYINAQKAADELGLPLIKTDSNFMTEFPQIHLYTHTYSSMFAVYCLQKLWKTFFYASGYGFQEFSLKNNADKASSYYDLLSLNCFSTRNLRLYSEGASVNRLEKTRLIADNKTAQKYLHVCIKEPFNCGTCSKCIRTILALYAINKLDLFKDVFDVDYFYKHKNFYFKKLCKYHLLHDKMNEPTYQVLKKEIPLRIKLTEFILHLAHPKILSDNLSYRLSYHKYHILKNFVSGKTKERYIQKEQKYRFLFK